MGKMIITSDCAGAHELLGDSEYGIVMENEDEAMYKTLKSVLGDIKCTEAYKAKVKERKEKPL